jgi:hypothetical protein
VSSPDSTTVKPILEDLICILGQGVVIVSSSISLPYLCV